MALIRTTVRERVDMIWFYEKSTLALRRKRYEPLSEVLVFLVDTLRRVLLKIFHREDSVMRILTQSQR